MTKDNIRIFKANFNLKFDEFLANADLSDIRDCDPSEEEDFKTIYDEFSHWYGETYGL